MHASQNMSIFCASQLPNVGCNCHWKSLNLRKILETPKVGFHEALRNIQAEARVFVSYKTCVFEDTWLKMIGLSASRPSNERGYRLREKFQETATTHFSLASGKT